MGLKKCITLCHLEFKVPCKTTPKIAWRVFDAVNEDELGSCQDLTVDFRKAWYSENLVLTFDNSKVSHYSRVGLTRER